MSALLGAMALLTAGLAQAGEVRFGSYGRVLASGDLSGGAGDPIDVVSFGTRLEKGPYTELDVIFKEEGDDHFRIRTVTTLALTGDLFHHDGEWDADLALRNLYAETSGFVMDVPLTAWAGSRMYRGVDVHLFDFWPLDNLNTVGGGLIWEPAGWRLAAHGGANRLLGDNWQVQNLDVIAPGGVGTESVEVLDRQRAIGSLKATRFFSGDAVSGSVSLYAEHHHLPEGVRLVDEQNLEERLPADNGGVQGLELALWGWGEGGYTRVWLRRASGLAAFGELTVPTTGLDAQGRAAAARQWRVAWELNHQVSRWSFLVGAWAQNTVDADANVADVDDRNEAALAVRPGLALSDHVTLFGEASVQQRVPFGLNPRSNTQDKPFVTKLSVFPAIRPGRGTFSRPELRLQYTYTHLNDDARLWYAWEDVRRQSNHHHFVGVGAEWWLNSATYSR